MTSKDDITRMARAAGLHLATDVNWMPIIGLEYAEKFASLVIANNPSKGAIMTEGYYCVVCGKYIEAVDGVIVHDDIPHPPDMTFDEEENPQ